MPLPDNATLRALLATSPRGPWAVEPGRGTYDERCITGASGQQVALVLLPDADDAIDLMALAPELAQRVLDLEARATKAEAERDAAFARANRIATEHSTLRAAAQEALDAYAAIDLHCLGGAARHGRALDTLRTLLGEG